MKMPQSNPALRTVAMPSDTNANGDIFGGWVMSQMDIAGAIPAIRRANGRVATVAVDSMRFHRPVQVGDLVSCFAELVKTGNTSVTVHVDTWAERRTNGEPVKVTEGTFVYVAINDKGEPRPVDEPVD
jgi:acyl-CoA thioesterase YciA